MPAVARSTFATSAANLVRANPEISYCAIVVNKERFTTKCDQADTKPETVNRDSRSCWNLQFVDMLAGVVGTHYEFQKSEPWRMLRPHVRLKQLFSSASTNRFLTYASEKSVLS
jgi:hypothetical protein